MNILRQLYEWTLKKSEHPKASWFLSIISFTESSFFPIPPDIILIPMVIAKTAKAWTYAFICTVSSVLGGALGYLIGFFFYNSIGILIVNYYGLDNQFTNFENSYNEYGFWIVLGAGFTPFPFKLITISSGLFGLNFITFILVAFVARGLRFFLLAGLLKLFGENIKKLIDQYFNLLAIIFFILLIGSFVLIKYL
tara:strand:- start:4745 stop:5329 length:585 start_codon:yes stop_codon:yes gene_type:complete